MSPGCGVCQCHSLRPSNFVLSYYVNSRVLGAYRAAAFVLLLATLVFGAVVVFENGLFFAFFTDITLILEFAMITSFRGADRAEEAAKRGATLFDTKEYRLPLGYRLLWVLFECVFSYAIIITVVFWALLWEPPGVPHLADAYIIMSHALNTLVIIPELIMNQLYFAPIHVLFVLLGAGIYVGFVFLWALWLQAGWLYPFLDVDSPSAPYMIPIVGVAFVLAFFLGLVVAKVRDAVKKRSANMDSVHYDTL